MVREIGKGERGAVALDLEVLLKSRLLVTASSGGGKTGALFQICETFADAVQIIILDWEGEFSPLRARYPFVLAGPGGETPAAVKTARLLARRLLELHASAICDIYELPHDQKHEFVKEFLEAMIEAPKHLWHPVLVIVDEAHLVAPEKGQGESAATGAVIDMASRGRKRGFCLIPATQRLAKLSKNVAAECQNVMVGRTTQVDQKRAAEVLNISGTAAKEEFGRRIGRMPTGEFVAYGMAFGVQTPEPFLVKRPHTLPTAESKRLVVPPTPKAVEGMLPQLSDIPVEAEKKAKTEEDLRAEIRDLKRAAAAPAALSAEDKGTIVMLQEKLDALAGEIKGIESRVAAMKKKLALARKAAQQLVEVLGEDDTDQVVGNFVEAIERETHAMQPQVQRLAQHVLAPPPMARPKPALAADGEGLTGPEQRILDALAWFEAIGVAEPEQPAVAFLAGYSVSSSSYTNPRGALKQKGFIQYVSGRAILTELGRGSAVPPDIAPTDEALQRAILAKLPGPEQRLLVPLLRAYPKGMDNQSLAEVAGYSSTSSSYTNPRGSLKSLGLIQYQSGMVFARNILFPEQN